jgi:hypothetical protein
MLAAASKVTVPMATAEILPNFLPIEGEAGRLIRVRGRQQAEAYRLFRVTSRLGQPPSAVLPQPRR